jgi:drug/metabolite transporter (DMT)-like permease
VLGFTAGDTLYFAAVPRCGAHVTAMLGNLAVPVAVLLGFVFLGESLELGVLAAMGVVVLGVLLVLTGRKSGRAGGVVLSGRGERWSGGLVAAASAACQGVAIAIGHEGFEGVGVLAGIEIRLAGGVASAFVVALLVDLPRSRGELRGLVRPFASRSLGLALVVPSIFAALLTLPLHGLGLREAPSGVAAVLFSTTPLFTLPIAWSLGERPTARTLLGTAIGFAGVVGVILLGHDGAP